MPIRRTRPANRIAVLLAAVSLAAAACSSSTDDASTDTTITLATTSTTTSSTTTTIPPTTTTTLPPAADAGIALPRAATYASVIFEVIGAEYSNDEPGTYLDDEPGVGEERYLYLGITADFEPDYPGKSEDFSVADFALILADGTAIPAEKVDFRGTILLSDEPQSSALAFPGGERDLTLAALTYDNAENEPMVLTLDGPVPEDPYPIAVDVDATADVEYEGGCANATGTVNVLDAEWDIDAGVDHERREIVKSGTTRTVVGERFVRIRLQSIASDGSCGGTVLTSDAFRLVVDGLPLGPENSVAELLKDGEGVELIWGFRVPIDADNVELEVGVVDGLVASIPIEKPNDLP
ncbi:MAG: hypothetical protein M3112_07550 [Actinomycetia bacterium]|nr:hypothetical protein [Actinomycetes bacterium]